MLDLEDKIKKAIKVGVSMLVAKRLAEQGINFVPMPVVNDDDEAS